MFTKSQFVDPVDYIVVRSDGVDVRTTTVPSVSVVVSYVQPFPAGLLLAGARCRWGREDPEQNALVVDWSGKVERAISIGDGVQDLRVTEDGHIWVSYFDEGVFGNYGWGSPGPTPIGATGIVGFDADGNVRFNYDATAAGTDSIVDAYAMNVAEDGSYEERGLGRVVTLDGERARVTAEVSIEDGRGGSFGDAVARGCGDRRYFFKDRQAFVLDSW